MNRQPDGLLAEPKCSLGGRVLRFAPIAVRRPPSACLLAIPAFDRIAGLCNRQLNCNRGMMVMIMIIIIIINCNWVVTRWQWLFYM